MTLRWPRVLSPAARALRGRARRDAGAPPVRRSLARRYAQLLCGVTLGLLLASGLTEAWFGYREARQHIAELQAAQAEEAARDISRYLETIETSLRAVARLPWGLAGFGNEQRRAEFYRLMQLQPAITDFQAIDAQGRERLAISKSATDRLESMRPFDQRELLAVAADKPVRYGPSFHRNDLSPAMRIAVFDGEGAIVATIDLRLLGEVVSRLHVGERGLAYIVDSGNRLVAHASSSEVLRQPDLRDFRGLMEARAIDWTEASTLALEGGTDFRGRPVIATVARIKAPGWLLFVEQPRAEALRPVFATLGRTALLVLVGGVLAVAIGVVSARRMAQPIVALRRATGRLAHGQLDSLLDVDRPDEIGDLANDFKAMATRLRESYVTLERKVDERTLQLSEARDVLSQRASEVDALNGRLVAQLGELASRKDEAERANAAKTRFLATASHDLRQPMHTVSLLVGALHERLAVPETRQIAEKALASVAAMEGLFASLLDISKLDAGVVRPEIAALPLADVFARLEQVWAPQAAERGLQLTLRPTRVVVRTDEMLIERIVGNLVSNAIRYTTRGAVLVAARRRGDAVLIQVWDTGPGIAPEHHHTIFEEFFRIDAPGSGIKGLGLGLSIVQRSAAILGHELALASRPGRGSRFELRLPFVGVEPSRAASAGATPRGSETIAGAFVLVADDDEGNRQALADVLRSWGCHVLAVASTQEALSKSQQHLRSPDVIVTDLQLDGQDTGLRLAAQLRALYDEAVPVIVITANTVSLPEKDLAALDALLLHKPVSTTRLAATVRQALSRRAAPE